MLDIIILYFLTRSIGTKAADKGLPPGKWKGYTILAWILGGLIGCSIGSILFGNQTSNPNDFSPITLLKIMLVAFPCSIAGYHIVRNQLDKTINMNS